MRTLATLLATAALAVVLFPTAAYSDEITPYHATLLTPSPRAGMDVAANQGRPPAGLRGLWALRVPGVAYTTTVDYGAITQSTLHVSAGAAAGYLAISGRRYIWYGSNGSALSHGTLVRVIPHLFADPHKSYWRVFEGREEHYIALSGDGTITVYDPGTNMYSMIGKRKG